MIFSVFQRIISVSNKIISVTEIIVDGGEAAMLLIRRDLPANRDNYFPHGKDPRRVANDLVGTETSLSVAERIVGVTAMIICGMEKTALPTDFIPDAMERTVGVQVTMTIGLPA